VLQRLLIESIREPGVSMTVPVAVAAIQLTPDQLRRRRRLSIIWAVVVVSWSLLRAVVVWAVLTDYGVNPWAYLLIDLASAGIDAITTPKFVLALIDSKYHEATRWGLLTLFAYVIPDIYIFRTTRELPKVAVMIICIVITLSLLAALVGVLTKVRTGKRGQSDPAALTDIGAHD
jgi:hypothetical protein